MTQPEMLHDIICAKCVECGNELRGIHMKLSDFRTLMENCGWEINEYKCPTCNGLDVYTKGEV